MKRLFIIFMVFYICLITVYLLFIYCPRGDGGHIESRPLPRAELRKRTGLMLA